MSNQVTIRSAAPANISKADIYSNESAGLSADLRGGLIQLMYYESILQDTVRATILFTDSGDTIEKDGKTLTAAEGLPIVGQERVDLVFEDNNDNEISFTKADDNALYVNKITPITDDSSTSLVMLDLVSKEFILNEKIRLNTRFDGLISDHVKDILTSAEVTKDGNKNASTQKYLDTKKSVEDWEESIGKFNFCGDNRKCFYTMNWLSKKAVPNQGNPQAMGNSAGYFLWETSEGYHFRSIDWLMNADQNQKKKSIIYNDSPDGSGSAMPEGYDLKALQAVKDNRVNIQEKLKMGAFSTRTILFNPFDCVYEVVNPDAYANPNDKNAKAREDTLTKAGEKLPTLNPEFDRKSEGKNKEFSRTQYMLVDTGTLIADGSKNPSEWSAGARNQLKASQSKVEGENFKIEEILSQSSMRYNQLFSTKISVTIPGEFSLHAGNSIFFDGPELTGSADKDEIDEKDGGLYIIADICHYSTSKETFTKMNLVRDSIERKGTPTGG